MFRFASQGHDRVHTTTGRVRKRYRQRLPGAVLRVIDGRSREARERLAGLTPAQVEADQRGRVFSALGAAVAEHGYRQMTVEHLVRGSGISRRTFYELFEGKEEAFCAAHAEALAELEHAVRGAAAAEREWSAAVAAGLAAALRWSAQQPAAAGLVTQPLAAGPRPAYCHDLLVRRFSPCLRGGRDHSRNPPVPNLEEMLLAGLAVTLGRQLREGRAEELPQLEPSLTWLVLTAYLGEGAR